MTAEDKPYGWVEVGPEPVRRALSNVRHDVIDPNAFTGRLILHLRAVTPVHVGAGEYTLDSSGRPVQAFVRSRGVPVIPGSTVKGAVRSLAEAVSLSCNPLGEPRDRCPKTVDKQELACAACRLFGYAGPRSSLRSRVRFGDCTLDGWPASGGLEVVTLPQPFPARGRGIHLRKFYRHVPLRAGPFPVEAVQAGATFTGEVWFLNLSLEELRLLAFSLGLDGSFHHKIGFAKSAGLGSVAISVSEVAFRLAPRGEKPDLAGLAREYGAADGRVGQAVRKVREILVPSPGVAGDTGGGGR